MAHLLDRCINILLMHSAASKRKLEKCSLSKEKVSLFNAIKSPWGGILAQ